ncbi:hypothetical protein D9M73_225160 [compost metagenome]
MGDTHCQCVFVGWLQLCTLAAPVRNHRIRWQRHRHARGLRGDDLRGLQHCADPAGIPAGAQAAPDPAVHDQRGRGLFHEPVWCFDRYRHAA